MRPISKWLHMMPCVVTVEPLASVDDYGKPTYGSPVTHRAHIQGVRTMIRDYKGEEVVSSQAVYFDSSVDILTTYRITLSTSDVQSTAQNALQPPILNVERRFDQNGPHHIIARLK